MTAFDDGTLHIDFVQQEVTIDREPVSLKPPEYRLLATLALHQGEVFTAERLMQLFGGVFQLLSPNSGVYLDVPPDKAGPEDGRRAD